MYEIQKYKSIGKIISCSHMYEQNLCNKDFLIVYMANKEFHAIEICFNAKNFQHLVSIKSNSPVYAEKLYKNCIDRKLSIKDFELTSIDHTAKKLAIFPHIATSDLSARKVCNYNNCGGDFVHLITDKFVGDESACIGIKNLALLTFPIDIFRNVKNFSMLPVFQVFVHLRKP